MIFGRHSQSACKAVTACYTIGYVDVFRVGMPADMCKKYCIKYIQFRQICFILNPFILFKKTPMRNYF